MIQNQTFAKQQLDSIRSMQESAQKLLLAYDCKDFTDFRSISMELSLLLEMLSSFTASVIPEEELFEKFHVGTIPNALFCLSHLEEILETAPEKTIRNSIQFELIPLLKVSYSGIYYLSCVKGDPEKEEFFLKEEQNKLNANTFIDESIRKSQYKYDVTIMMQAYNHFEHTKECLKSILKNLPKNFIYELVLVNHGSEDNIQQLFEAVKPHKIIHLKHNELITTSLMVHQSIEGKYLCFISNDILVGHSAIENMLICMESDENISIVVPTTPNIANLQSIPLSFSTIDELNEKTKEHNVSNPRLWEQRVRLCDPVLCVRSKDWISSEAYLFVPFSLSFTGAGFGDDYVSLQARRHNGKCVLAKDAFCFHSGSLTMRDEKDYLRPEPVKKKCKIFQTITGIDPISVGFCYSYGLFMSEKTAIQVKNQGHVEILGVETGLGSNPLKIKSILKEVEGNEDCNLTCISKTEVYQQDLSAIADNFEIIQNLEEFSAFTQGKQFHYIVYEDKMKIKGSSLEIYHLLKSALTEDGVLIMQDPPTSANKLFQGHKVVEERDDLTGKPFYWWIFRNS